MTDTDPIVRLDAETFLVRSTPRWTATRYKLCTGGEGGFIESSEEIIDQTEGVVLRFDSAERLCVWHDGTALFDAMCWSYFLQYAGTREHDSDSEDDCLSTTEWREKNMGQMHLKNELKVLAVKVWGELGEGGEVC